MFCRKEDERLANIYSYLRVKSWGQKYKDVFEVNDKIIIYGCGELGRALCYELSLDRDVICILDKNSTANSFNGIPILKLGSKQCLDFFNQFENLKIIVTPTYDYEQIVNELKSFIPNALYYPVYSLNAYFEVKVLLGTIPRLDELLDIVLNKDNGKVKSISYSTSLYNLLIYMIYHEKWSDTLFVTQFYRPGRKLVDEIEKNGGIWMPLGAEIFDGSYDYNALRGAIRSIALWTHNRDVEIYGQDIGPYTLLFEDDNLTVVEDGLVSYYTPEKIKREFPGMYRANQGKVAFANLEKVKKVLFIRNADMPIRYKKKAIIIDLRKKWSEFDYFRKTKILEAFSLSNQYINELRTLNKKIMLVTSNYAGNGLCSLEEQKIMFRKVMENYDENDVIIKPHPMDQIDYSELFPRSYVIDVVFPIELLLLVDIGIEKLVGIVSNGLTNLAGFYQVDTYEELKEKYWV